MIVNKFDKVCLDIEAEFQKQDSLLKYRAESGMEKNRMLYSFFCIIKMYFFGFLQRTGILKRLAFGNYILEWFFEFKRFWVDYLDNRPIDIFDFHFLRGIYRVRFQEVSLRDEKSDKKFVTSWQESANLYLLFQGVWSYGQKSYLNFYPFLKYIPQKANILEFGCGIAPITTGLVKYCKYKNLNFTLADIKQINFLYARWRFEKNKNVKFLTINPAKKDSLTQNELYDVIVCLTVFEHLPYPTQTVYNFLDHLKRGGILIFDYIKQEVGGLDTKAGQRERDEVLKFIEKNFDILEGMINFRDTMGLTVARKL